MHKNKTAGFVHLHLHSEFSPGNGTIRFHELFKKLKRSGMNAVALTDNGNLFGAYQFYREAKFAGIKPIIGCELYVGSILNDKDSIGRDAYHLTVLAMNEEGYRNLSEIVSISQVNKQQEDSPLVDKELLTHHSEGLIVLSGCLESELSKCLIDNASDKAFGVAGSYSEVFGNRYYLEVQATKRTGQRIINEKLKEIGGQLKIPLVATNDCHYLGRGDSRTYNALLHSQAGMPLNNSGSKSESDECYVKSKEEMLKDMEGFEEALAEAEKVANRCNYEFESNDYKLPEITFKGHVPPDEYLENITRVKLMEKIAGGIIKAEDSQIYSVRLEKEIEIIRDKRLCAYLLIAADCVSFARLNGIQVGPGFGSLPGSLAAYLLGITEIDPIRYNLLFERYLNPRVSARNFIYILLDPENRAPVVEYLVEYLKERYGDDRVSLIGYHHRITPIEAIEKSCKALGASCSEADEFIKILLKDVCCVYSIRYCMDIPQLQSLLKRSPILKDIIDLACEFDGMFKGVSDSLQAVCPHDEQGVAISFERISNKVPLYRNSENSVMTQFDDYSLDELHLERIYFVGSPVLTRIKKTIDLVYSNNAGKHPMEFDLNNIPLDDPRVYDLLSKGDTDGVIEGSSKNMKKFLERLKPSTFEDIISFAALYRRGPIEEGLADDFIKRKHGIKWVDYIIPELRSILQNTYGLYIYQEQIMETANRIAGYNLADADLLRRTLGKKKPEEIKSQKEKFISGAAEKMIDMAAAEELFNQMAEYAEYSYNRSHAAAMAVLLYRAAYLKAHYPKEFLSACSFQPLNH